MSPPVKPGEISQLLAERSWAHGLVIVVRFADDGHEERVRVQDYARVYAVAGLYEAIVQDRLACQTPDRVATMLARAMPGATSPWDALWWTPRIHLLLFVHRVTGVDPGARVVSDGQTSIGDGEKVAVR